MKLYWSPRSPFVRKVLVCAHELGIVERIEKIYALVSLNQVNRDVMRVNPLGRIPALVADDGTVLYDSHVVCEYLDAQYGGSRLFPANAPHRWTALRRLALADGMLETLVLWRAERVKAPPQQSSGLLVAFDGKIESALTALENDASSLKHDDIDIGEIAIACALGYLDFRFVELDWRTRCPSTALWFGTFNRRSSMQDTLPYEE